MIKTSVEHLGIAAKDTAALSEWYCRVFGFKEVYKGSKTPPTYIIASPQGGAMLEILPASELGEEKNEGKQGLRHFALTVEDIDAAKQILSENGANIMYAKDASGGVKVLFFTDPEGNIVQLIYRPNPLV